MPRVFLREKQIIIHDSLCGLKAYFSEQSNHIQKVLGTKFANFLFPNTKYDFDRLIKIELLAQLIAYSR